VVSFASHCLRRHLEERDAIAFSVALPIFTFFGSSKLLFTEEVLAFSQSFFAAGALDHCYF
jgi:hypothetical protein